jgi:hypothetical protein
MTELPVSRTCVKCGQMTITSADTLCERCYEAILGRERFEAMRLFTPAPTQIPGQLGF